MSKQVKLKKAIGLECSNDDEKMKLGTRIHEALRGKPDYIENRIVLNIDEPNKVLLLIYEDCTIDYKSILDSVM